MHLAEIQERTLIDVSLMDSVGYFDLALSTSQLREQYYYGLEHLRADPDNCRQQIMVRTISDKYRQALYARLAFLESFDPSPRRSNSIQLTLGYMGELSRDISATQVESQMG